MARRVLVGILLTLAAICLLPGVAAAATYHVNPAGDDSAAGDDAHPLATISRAAELAGPGDVVLIAPGVYREWVALRRSGQPGKPITFQAEKTGTAIISGADPLTIWTPVPNHLMQFITDWPHDFVIDTNPDGTPVRNHGAPAPVGCAEQILWESHPLRQVMKSDDLVPGGFFVDWQYHTLTVCLPGGVDPRNTTVEGCVRSYLMSPAEKYNVFADARFIAVRGLVLRDAANFAQRGGFVLGTGWHVQDCTVENNNAGGISLNGNDILLQRTVSQFNGFSGIDGTGSNNTLEDCTVRGNNRKGFPPAWSGGGGKFVQTDHLRVIRHTSYDNTGPGLWLDIDNVNYSITDSIFHGNRGLDADWEGIGIFLEISPGPGEVSGNLLFSNTGAGINLAESQGITVEKNTLFDNGDDIALRAMTGRDHHNLDHITIAHNRFKEWHHAAIATSLGDWSPRSIAERSIGIDQNIYDPPRDRPFIAWGDLSLANLPAIRSKLGLEAGGDVQTILVSRAMEKSRTIADPARSSILRAMKNVQPGQTFSLPASGRSSLGDDGVCSVFDGDDTWVTLSIPADLRQIFQTALPTGPVIEPVVIQVRLDESPPGGPIRATLVSVG